MVDVIVQDVLRVGNEWFDREFVTLFHRKRMHEFHDLMQDVFVFRQGRRSNTFGIPHDADRIFDGVNEMLGLRERIDRCGADFFDVTRRMASRMSGNLMESREVYERGSLELHILADERDEFRVQGLFGITDHLPHTRTVVSGGIADMIDCFRKRIAC